MSARVAPGSRWLVAAGTAVIAAACAGIYQPVFRGEWLWDDRGEIPQNPVLRDFGGLATIWRGASGPDYFPLKTTVQWLQWHLWGEQVLGYHLTNVGLHLLAALLVWKLSAKLGIRGAAAWLAGLLFAVHPGAVESVAWMSELKNTLSLALLLCAMIAYLEYDQTRRSFPYLKALGWFIAAMLAKTSVAMFPAILLLFTWWRHGRIGVKDLKASAPFFGVSFVLGLLTVNFQNLRVTAHLPMTPESLAMRFATAGRAVLFYLEKGLLPIHLSPIYPHWTGDDRPGVRWLPWGMIGAVALWFWWRRATWGRHALFGFGSFLFNLLPVLGLLPMAFRRISPVSDHLGYLSLVSVVVTAAAFLGVSRRSVMVGSLWLAVGLAVIAWGNESRGYARQFVSEETLWTYTLARNPDAWLAHNNLGIVYARSGRIAQAVAEGESAVRLRPEFPETRSNLGLTLTTAGRLAEAIAQLDAAVRLAPTLPGAHLNLGRALLLSGRANEAVAEFAAALQLDPSSVEARSDLGVAHNNLGNSLARAGRLTEAVTEFEQALLIDPGNSGAHRNLGFALAGLGRTAAAQLQFQTAQRLGGPP
jgi:protein O-mannosyl-transferase